MIKETDESSTSGGINETPDLFPEEFTTEAEEILDSENGDDSMDPDEDNHVGDDEEEEEEDEDTTDVLETVEATITSANTEAPSTITEASNALNISKPLEDRCRGDDKFRCGTSNIIICETERCDGTEQCDNGEDEVDCPKDTPTRS